MASAARKDAEEPKPLLILMTEPFLKLLATKGDRDGPEIQLKPAQFWPFAVAGAALFGVGIWGGYAFMGGDVPNEHQPPPEEAAAKPAGAGGGTGRRRGAVIKAEQEAEARPRRTRTRADYKATNAASRLTDVHAQAQRSAALKTASLSLALGTLLALTGAGVAVKVTSWYLKVDTIADFAEKMRSYLPVQARLITQSVALNENKNRWVDWFQRSNLGRFIKRQEAKQQHAQRIKEVEGNYKRGVLTELEKERDLAVIALSKPF